jgi:hypothetical protein
MLEPNATQVIAYKYTVANCSCIYQQNQELKRLAQIALRADMKKSTQKRALEQHNSYK